MTTFIQSEPISIVVFKSITVADMLDWMTEPRSRESVLEKEKKKGKQQNHAKKPWQIYNFITQGEGGGEYKLFKIQFN